MRGNSQDDSMSFSMDEGIYYQVDSDALLAPPVDTDFLLRLGMGSIVMLLFTLYNFLWNIYRYLSPRTEDGINVLFIAFSLLPAMALALHQLRTVHIARTERTDKIYSLVFHGRCARYINPFTIFIAFFYIISFIFPYCYSYLNMGSSVKVDSTESAASEQYVYDPINYLPSAILSILYLVHLHTLNIAFDEDPLLQHER